MSLHVNLSFEMEGFVKSKVAAGFYAGATEVIRDVLRRRQAEDTRIAVWKAAVKVGDNPLDRAQSIANTPAALQDITDAAISAMHSGTSMNPDALP